MSDLGVPKNYVEISEKDFWKQKSLKLTIKGSILREWLQIEVKKAIDKINLKIDEWYDMKWLNLDNWEYKVNQREREQLLNKMRDIVMWFNEEIARLDEKYIWATVENRDNISKSISAYFSDKSLFVANDQFLWARSLDDETLRAAWINPKKVVDLSM